jgi:hypothetical protein
MKKKERENTEAERIAERYRELSDQQLLYLHSEVMSPNADTKYKKAYNIVLKEKGLKQG